MTSAWRMFIVVSITMNLAIGAWAKLTGIKYFMATCGGQNCNTVCATFGLQCARTGQSFPHSSTLPIFESLGITCKTNNYSDHYKYEDQPNYIADSASKEWIGICTGFTAIPSTIDCHTANNTLIRRLCPCYDPLVTQSPTPSTATPTTKKITNTASETSEHPVTSAETRVTQKHSTLNDLAEPQKQIEGTTNVERPALIIAVAFLAAGLVLCLSGLVFLFLWNRKQIREKRDEEPDSEKLHVEYHRNNNETGVPDVMDGLAVEIETEENNSYCEMRAVDLSLHSANEMDVKTDLAMDSSTFYEDMTGKTTDNVLYASVPGKTNAVFSSEQAMPVYDRLV